MSCQSPGSSKSEELSPCLAHSKAGLAATLENHATYLINLGMKVLQRERRHRTRVQTQNLSAYDAEKVGVPARCLAIIGGRQFVAIDVFSKIQFDDEPFLFEPLQTSKYSGWLVAR